MIAPRPLLVSGVVVSLAAVAAGCGSDDDAMPPSQPRASARAEDFPRPTAATTIQGLLRKFPRGPQLSPTAKLFAPGATNRYGFGVFDRTGKLLQGVGMALYTARANGSDVRGPYVARSESLHVRPQFIAKTTSQDPMAAKGVYVSDLPMPRAKKIMVLGVAKLDGRLVSTTPIPTEVRTAGAQPPAVGERAIRVHTPTLDDVAGNAAKIDTRIPPAKDLLRDDLADVLGRKPVVLVFATPQFCQSRVCGPVVDIAEQLKSQVGDRVSVIHSEIYRDNDTSKGPTAAVGAYHLPSEPWTFVIDRRGIVRARFEGALSMGELERAVAKVE